MTVDDAVLTDYVMGALTPQQEQQVASHLNAHPHKADQVRDMFESVADIALSVPPAAVPDGAAEALLARIRSATTAPDSDLDFGSGFDDGAAYQDTFEPPTITGTRAPHENQFDTDINLFLEHTNIQSETDRAPDKPAGLSARRKSIRSAMLIALVAALLVAVWLGFQEQLLNYQIAQRLDRTCRVSGVQCRQIIGDANTPLGTLATLADGQFVIVFNSAPQEQVYQAWQLSANSSRLLGIWSTRVLEIPLLAPGSRLAVTLEPATGSRQPSGQLVLLVPAN